MTILIEVDTEKTFNGVPSILVNGEPLRSRRLTIVPRESDPFKRVMFDDEPQYDVEIWIDGIIRDVVPKKSPWSESIYELSSKPRVAMKRNAQIPQTATVNELRERLLGKMSLVLKDAEFDQWQTLRRMNAVWVSNGVALISLLEKLATDHELAIEMIQNVRPTGVREVVELQLDQNLFNYLSSMRTMVDVTRTLMSSYEGTEFWSRYNLRKNDFTSNEAFNFVSNLRNYNLHYALPIGGHSVSFENIEENFKSIVTASRDELLKWKKWPSDTRKYLQNSEEWINLTKLFQEHFSAFKSSWKWILEQFAGLHGLQIFVRDEMAREVNWLLTLGALETPRREWLIPPEYQAGLERWYEA